MKKLDVYEAAEYALNTCPALAAYFAEDGITSEDLKGQAYEVVEAALSILLKRAGRSFTTDEEVFEVMTAEERKMIGERRLIGDKGTYIVSAGKQAEAVIKTYFSHSFDESCEFTDYEQGIHM